MDGDTLLLHHVEALVRTTHQLPLDRLAGLVLQSLVLGPAATLAELGHRLALDPQILGGVLVSLARKGLAAVDAAGSWSPTARAQSLLEAKTYRWTAYERRLFYFRETALADCSPRYISLAAPAGTPCLPPDGWTFNPDVLEACAAQSLEWKRRHGFPLEIDALVRLDSQALPPTPARKVLRTS